MTPPPLVSKAVFLNIPYDKRFQQLYLAYIAGLIDLGMTPVATLGIPGGSARIGRIFRLLQTSRYSIHDLSRVQIDTQKPRTPRFNMPFELGLAVAWADLHPKRHTYFVCESQLRRGHKSLSDLAGSDFNIHDGTPAGVMRELCSAFVRVSQRPTVPRMLRRYELLRAALPQLLRENGTANIYEARMFDDLVLLAKKISESDRLR